MYVYIYICMHIYIYIYIYSRVFFGAGPLERSRIANRGSLLGYGSLQPSWWLVGRNSRNCVVQCNWICNGRPAASQVCGARTRLAPSITLQIGLPDPWAPCGRVVAVGSCGGWGWWWVAVGCWWVVVGRPADARHAGGLRRSHSRFLASGGFRRCLSPPHSQTFGQLGYHRHCNNPIIGFVLNMQPQKGTGLSDRIPEFYRPIELQLCCIPVPCLSPLLPFSFLARWLFLAQPLKLPKPKP